MPEIGGMEFSKFKKILTDCLVENLSPITAEMRRICADVPYIDSVLKDGGERANAIAEPILKQVYDIVGFLRE